MADAVPGVKSGRKTPDGCHELEHMVHRMTSRERVLPCGTCMDARGIGSDEIVERTERSTMDALAAATETSERVPVFRALPAECAAAAPGALEIRSACSRRLLFRSM